jgi:hypothetical protein
VINYEKMLEDEVIALLKNEVDYEFINIDIFMIKN